MENKEKNVKITDVSTVDVEARMIFLRNQSVIADADVADLYGVETRAVNQAVRNNLDKFPSDYVFELSKSELLDLKSKILISKVSDSNRRGTKAFTEKGLYMLATILKSGRWCRFWMSLIEGKSVKICEGTLPRVVILV